MAERTAHQARRHEELSAREMVIMATERIDAHVAECNRRDEVFQRQYSEDMRDLKDAIERVHGRVSGLSGKVSGLVMGMGGALIVGLFGLVAFLLIYGPPWHPIDPS